VSTPPSPVAILDFADSIGAAPRRRVFGRPTNVLRAAAVADVVPVLDAAERHARGGGWAVGFVAYEAAVAFDAAMRVASPAPLPLAWFALFDAPDWSGEPPIDPPDPPGGDVVLHEPTDDGLGEGYAQRVRAIRDRIAAGDVYQVNLTVPFTASAEEPARRTYERMRLAQGGAYSAFLHLGDACILSASPELFFERRGDTIRARPMKGTAPRGPYPEADLVARGTLVGSEKERAENVMIVDVVRNDIGRVARTGTVRVTSLCEVERYPSVWQLTSTVEGCVPPAGPLSAVFGALFPPASVTGAPKVSAVGIIRELEQAPRGVYCGAIGCIRPGGDATFNVAIRTGWTTDDGRILRLNAGGGITIDSTVSAESAEVRAKVEAFTRLRARPALFETIRIERGSPCRLDRHLERLAASARHFDVPFDLGEARALATVGASGLALGRARLVLGSDGALSASVAPFEEHEHASGTPRRVRLATEPVDRDDPRLYHKTLDRERYELAAAAAPDAFDVVLWNRQREATELTRGNLVVEIGGVCWTPMLSCGLLPGVLRAELLASGTIRERVIHVGELRRAERLWRERPSRLAADSACRGSCRRAGAPTPAVNAPGAVVGGRGSRADDQLSPVPLGSAPASSASPPPSWRITSRMSSSS
jgi:para-aminobenzoate synthetase/4-amino-4-deoxychorismate lyase